MESEANSNRLESLRRRLSTVEVEIDTPTWRDRLSSLDRGCNLPAETLRERLSTPGSGQRVSPEIPGGAELSRHLPTAGVRERLSCGNLRARLSDSGLCGHAATPTLGDRLTTPTLGDRLTTPTLGDRLTTPTLGEYIEPPAVRERLGSAELERPSLPDAEELILEQDGVDRETHESPTTTPEYFVGVVPESHDTVRERLEGSAFVPSHVTYPKILDDEEFDIRVEASSVWVYRSWPLSHFQLHVPLFEIPGEEGVHVFFHHEYNWLRHPSTHKAGEYLNPEWGRDQVLELFDEAGLTVQTSGDCADPNEFATTYWQAAESQEVRA